MEFLKSINTILDSLYPQNVSYEETVLLATQQEAIEKMKSNIFLEQFFLVLNLAERKLEHVNGFEKWLGYRDETFSFFDYLKIIHPSHLPSLTSLAKSAFTTANSGNHQVSFMSHNLSIQLPLLHRNGKYILTKRSLYPFQIDVNGKVLSYLNHFVILKEFDERDAMEPRVGGANLGQIQSEVEQTSKSLNENAIKWSKKEKRILELVKEEPNLTNREISDKLQISYETLCKTDNHRITRKAKDYFKLDSFNGIKDVAFFLKNQGLL